MIDIKGKKHIHDIMVKMSNVFDECYIFKNGYIGSIDNERPFIIQITPKDIELFSELFGEFKIVHIPDVKEFKKALSEPSKADKEKGRDQDWPQLENTYYIVTLQSELNKAIQHLKEKVEEINSCMKWENFTLSDDAEANVKLILSLFNDNNYVNFRPKDTDSPEIILTKSLLPLVSEKNYTDLYYASKKISSDLFLIIFDFQFTLFRLFMLHHYLPLNDN